MGWGLSGVILMGRRFPGSSGPGDLSNLGVGGRPVGLCGGLRAGAERGRRKKIKVLKNSQNPSKGAIIQMLKRTKYFISVMQLPFSTLISAFFYLPGEGAVTLLVFLPGDDERFAGGRVRIGVSGSDRLLHDFLTPSRSFIYQHRKWQ